MNVADRSEIVQFMDDLVIWIIDELVVGGAASVTREVEHVLPTVLTLYIILCGYRLLGGMVPVRNLVFEMLKVTMVLFLIVKFELYNEYVKDPLYVLPEYLAAAVTGTDSSKDVIGLLDEVLTTGFRVGAKYWSEASLFSGDFGLYFVAILIWISVAVPTALATFLLVLSKLYIGVLLILGPLVILLTLFERTSGYFSRWIGEIVTRSLTIMFAILVPKIMLFYFEQNLAEIEHSFTTGNGAFATMLLIIFFSIVQILFYWQVPVVASALGGGFQLAPHGMDRRVHAALLSTPAAVSGASRVTGRWADRLEARANENPIVAEVQRRRRPAPWR